MRAKEELKKLKTTERDNKKRREDAMKDMEKGVKQAQQQSNAVRAQVVALRGRRDALAAEIKACNSELSTISEQRMVCEAAVQRLITEIIGLEAQVT